MDTESIFNQNVDYLIQIRDEVSRCNQLEQYSKQLKDKQDKLQKAISQEEKSIHDEITTTVKKRKNEIEKTYDDQLDAGRKKIKKAQDEKSREKLERVGQRVDEETADVKEHTRQLKTEMVTLFKKNHVPSFCRSELYYILFMPKGVKEILVLIVFILIGLAGIPYGSYRLFSGVVFAGKKFAEAPYFMAIVIALTLLIVLGIYFLIFNLTKVRHRDVIAEGRKIRNQMVANDKNVQAIKNAINKDKDESQYELGEYDARIEKLQEELDVVAQQKQNALTEFEQQTKQVITDEINGRRQGKVEELKQQCEATGEEQGQTEAQIKESSLNIADRYAKYLGKNICKEETLNDIINIMQTEQIDTISEGIAIYKGETPHRNQESLPEEESNPRRG